MKGKWKRTTEFLGSVQQCQFVLLCGVFQYKPHKRLNTPKFIHGAIAALSCFLTGYQLGGKCKNTVSRLDPPLDETLYWLSLWCRVPSFCPLSSVFVLLHLFCLISRFDQFVVFSSLFLLNPFFPCWSACWTGDVHHCLFWVGMSSWACARYFRRKVMMYPFFCGRDSPARWMGEKMDWLEE